MSFFVLVFGISEPTEPGVIMSLSCFHLALQAAELTIRIGPVFCFLCVWLGSVFFFVGLGLAFLAKPDAEKKKEAKPRRAKPDEEKAEPNQTKRKKASPKPPRSQARRRLKPSQARRIKKPSQARRRENKKPPPPPPRSQARRRKKRAKPRRRKKKNLRPIRITGYHTAPDIIVHTMVWVLNNEGR